MAETRRKFDQDFREGAVRLVRETGKPIAQVARDLGIHDGTLANWVNADRRRRGERHLYHLGDGPGFTTCGRPHPGSRRYRRAAHRRPDSRAGPPGHPRRPGRDSRGLRPVQRREPGSQRQPATSVVADHGSARHADISGGADRCAGPPCCPPAHRRDAPRRRYITRPHVPWFSVSMGRRASSTCTVGHRPESGPHHSRMRVTSGTGEGSAVWS